MTTATRVVQRGEGHLRKKREMDLGDAEKTKCGSFNYKVRAFLHYLYRESTVET